jgi:hypothetical protein
MANSCQALDDMNSMCMALSAAETLILGQMLRITYLLYSLGSRLVGALWRRIGAAQPGQRRGYVTVRSLQWS